MNLFDGIKNRYLSANGKKPDVLRHGIPLLREHYESDSRALRYIGDAERHLEEGSHEEAFYWLAMADAIGGLRRDLVKAVLA